MNKTSRPKETHRTEASPADIDRLIADYLKAKEALETGPGITHFRGQPVTRDSLSERFFAAGEAQGLEKMHLLMLLTVATNA